MANSAATDIKTVIQHLDPNMQDLPSTSAVIATTSYSPHPGF